MYVVDTTMYVLDTIIFAQVGLLEHKITLKLL